ncbi:phage adaptor protein [Cytobacillus oceanisediminis]|uniref:phage adaptor protein n=1 Tax=Cytobacillus oceanisediminis TaxID=665099 RepID=UPI0037369626
MKLSDLIKEVNKDIDDSLSNGEITGWLNRALDDLTPYAKYQAFKTISLISEQKEYSLPADLFEIIHLVDENDGKSFNQIPMQDFSSNGYKRWGGKLIFQPLPKQNKDISLYYHARLPHLVNPDDAPVISEEFHDLLVLFAVAKAKYQDEEESMQNNAMQEYFMRKEQFISFNQSGETYTVQEVYW